MIYNCFCCQFDLSAEAMLFQWPFQFFGCRDGVSEVSSVQRRYLESLLEEAESHDPMLTYLGVSCTENSGTDVSQNIHGIGL